MSVPAEKLYDDAQALPAADRRRLAESLLRGLPSDRADDIEQAWIEEACRRAGRLERGETQARNGETALADLEAKLRSIHGL